MFYTVDQPRPPPALPALPYPDQNCDTYADARYLFAVAKLSVGIIFIRICVCVCVCVF